MPLVHHWVGKHRRTLSIHVHILLHALCHELVRCTTARAEGAYEAYLRGDLAALLNLQGSTLGNCGVAAVKIEDGALNTTVRWSWGSRCETARLAADASSPMKSD